ncbi:MAG: hypothetical protein O9284_07625 [Steroidobacteraceae bacterium]|jgi:hypothetical protein|nr:hypothetical protein [Steroidobacteraceae bacterium]
MAITITPNARRDAPEVSGASGAIPYSKFRRYTVNDRDPHDAPVFPVPFIEGSRFKASNTGIDEPAVQVNFEDWLPNTPDIVWKVLGDQPFRQLCICLPNPGYPIPVANSVRGGG